MKKLFITLIAILSCISCSTQKDTEPVNTESVIISDTFVEKVGRFYKIKYENHYYIIWINGYKGGLVHDPDCDCNK